MRDLDKLLDPPWPGTDACSSMPGFPNASRCGDKSVFFFFPLHFKLVQHEAASWKSCSEWFSKLWRVFFLLFVAFLSRPDHYAVRFSATMTSRLRGAFRVTSVALNGVDRTLQLLLVQGDLWSERARLHTVSSVITVVTLWLPDFLVKSRSSRRTHCVAGTYEDAAAFFRTASTSSPLQVLEALLLSARLCLCSWKIQQDYQNTAPTQIYK